MCRERCTETACGFHRAAASLPLAAVEALAPHMPEGFPRFVEDQPQAIRYAPWWRAPPQSPDEQTLARDQKYHLRRRGPGYHRARQLCFSPPEHGEAQALGAADGVAGPGEGLGVGLASRNRAIGRLGSER